MRRRLDEYVDIDIRHEEWECTTCGEPVFRLEALENTGRCPHCDSDEVGFPLEVAADPEDAARAKRRVRANTEARLSCLEDLSRDGWSHCDRNEFARQLDDIEEDPDG